MGKISFKTQSSLARERLVYLFPCCISLLVPRVIETFIYFYVCFSTFIQDEKKYLLWSSDQADDEPTDGGDITAIIIAHSSKPTEKTIPPPINHKAASDAQNILLAEKWENTDPTGKQEGIQLKWREC